MSDEDQSALSSQFDTPEYRAGLTELRSMADGLETENAWPKSQFRLLQRLGVLGWAIPQQWGGSNIPGRDLLAGYQQLAEACLTTTFVLTQRNGACQRIAGSENAILKDDLLPQLCQGDLFATVGISHLTTSRQHVERPVMHVRQTSSGFVFNGFAPWVTGAKYADYIVTGGTLDDGRQVLAAVPTDLPGVTVKSPVQLMALNASQTGPVELKEVEVDARNLLAGPVEKVMRQGQGGGAGSLTTSALALGATANALRSLQDEAQKRSELQEIFEPLNNEWESVNREMFAIAEGEAIAAESSVTAETVRRRANSLVLRSTQTVLAASKGAGFVEGHPAGRGVREAMFFLVWSCPQPVLQAALREFACVNDA